MTIIVSFWRWYKFLIAIEEGRVRIVIEEALEDRLSKMEGLELTIANLQLAKKEARKTIDRLSALIPREANDNTEESLAGERDDK